MELTKKQIILVAAISGAILLLTLAAVLIFAPRGEDETGAPTAAPTETIQPTPTITPTPTNTPRPTPTMDPSVLPQTGQTWWPVPLLMAAGLGLVLMGMVLRRGDADED